MQILQKIPVKTKTGTFELEMSAKGLYAIHFPKLRSRQRGQTLGACLSPLLRKIRRMNLDLSGCAVFEKKVYCALQKVPAGKVISYGELAKRAGYPGAARAVGSAMRKNRLPIVIPCHRVVPATGGFGEYSAGKKWKCCLLGLERLPSKSIRVSRFQSAKS